MSQISHLGLSSHFMPKTVLSIMISRMTTPNLKSLYIKLTELSKFNKNYGKK